MVPAEPSEPFVAGLLEVLALVRERGGIDFAGYRRPTLERRVLSRMAAMGAATVREYLELLDGDPEEVGHLSERLTIKVSRFFRNAEVFRRLEAILASCRSHGSPGERLRVWSAGCGNGEEPYSLAMLLCQLQGAVPAGSVLATDVDGRALSLARRGWYGPESLAEVPDALRAQALVPSACPARPHQVDPGIAAGVTFLRHDLTSGSALPFPFGNARFHLVCCRNVLIYLGPRLQERVLHLVRQSLAPGGHLCLGEAEWPAASVLPFLDVVDRSARIFRAKPAASRGDR